MPSDTASLLAVNFKPNILEALDAHLIVLASGGHGSELGSKVLLLGQELEVQLQSGLVGLHTSRVGYEKLLHLGLHLSSELGGLSIRFLSCLVDEVEHLDGRFVGSNQLVLAHLDQVAHVVKAGLDLKVFVQVEISIHFPESNDVRTGTSSGQNSEIRAMVVWQSMSQEFRLAMQLKDHRNAFVGLGMSIVGLDEGVGVGSPVLDLAFLSAYQDVGMVQLEELSGLVSQVVSPQWELSSGLEIEGGDGNKALPVVGEAEDSSGGLSLSKLPVVDLDHLVLLARDPTGLVLLYFNHRLLFRDRVAIFILDEVTLVILLVADLAFRLLTGISLTTGCALASSTLGA